MKTHWEVLTKRQIALLKTLDKCSALSSYYLGGGTALAMAIGHRKSIDFDFFTQRMENEPLKLAEELRSSGIDFSITGVEKGTLHGLADEVKVSFLEYQYPLLVETVQIEETDVSMAGLADLLSMKLIAVAQRGSRKDFVDVWFLLNNYFALTEARSLLQRKYGYEEFGSILVGLSYFADAENDPMPQMLLQVNWSDIKKDIQLKVAEYSAG